MSFPHSFFVDKQNKKVCDKDGVLPSALPQRNDESSIWNEKLRFFESVGKKASQRRQTEKSDAKTKNIEDIMS